MSTSSQYMDLADQLRRRAILLEIGGFRPSEDPLSSWFGRVTSSAPGEAWPTMDGEPMHALCQVNLKDLPFRPPRLEDIEFMTVFIGPGDLPIDAPNGQSWCLRTYRESSVLQSLEQVDTGSSIKPFPMRPQIVEADFPCWEDVQIELPEDVKDNYFDLFPNTTGFKLGGWPTLVQSEIYWAPWNRHPAAPEYVFQIDSTEKGGWSWSHGGVGYFGRGTTQGHEDEWVLQWQSL